MKKALMSVLTFSLFITAAMAAERTQDSRSFSVGSDARLDLKNVSGDINIRQGGSDQIEVSYKSHDDRIEVFMEQDGDRVTVTVEYPRRTSTKGGVDFDIVFPATGRLDITSVSGAVEVADISGRIKLRSVSGDVKLDGLSGELDAASVSGDVELRNIGEAEVEAVSVSGNVDFDGDLIGGDFTFNSTSGKVQLKFSPSSSFSIKGDTVSGRISSSVNEIDVEKGEYVGMSMSGERNGGDVKVSARSVSGKVTVDLQ